MTRVTRRTGFVLAALSGFAVLAGCRGQTGAAGESDPAGANGAADEVSNEVVDDFENATADNATEASPPMNDVETTGPRPRP